MITREDLSDVMTFDPEEYLTTTLYLNIESNVQPTYAIELKDMIKKRKKELDTQELTASARKSVNADFKKINDYVNLKFARENVRTLVVLSCSGKKWFRVHTIPLHAKSQLIVAKKPYLQPLNLIFEEYSRFLVILVERSKARIFEVYSGEITERSDILDEVPGKVRMGGFSGYEERKIERHIEDHVRWHYKKVADSASEIFHRLGCDSVILFGSEQNINDFKNYLPVDLQDRIEGKAPAEMISSPRDILEKTSKLEQELKARREKRLVERLFNEVNSGGLGIVGMESTIRALQQGQVNYLLVQEGFEKTGFQCVACSSLLTGNGSCDYCGGKTQELADLVGAAVQQAIDQGCQVKFISLQESPLVAAGKMGAVLRFKV